MQEERVEPELAVPFYEGSVELWQGADAELHPPRRSRPAAAGVSPAERRVKRRADL